MSIEVFTFWIGSTMYAVDLKQVLSIQQANTTLEEIPVPSPGLMGVSTYLGMPTPIFDLAERLGLNSSRNTKHQLADMLNQREQEHIDWLNALEESLRSGREFDKAISPDECAFGRWYNQFKTKDIGLKDILEKFDQPHRHIHSLAKELLSMSDKEAALARLHEERTGTLAKLRRLFELARRQVLENIRPVILYITMDGKKPKLGLMIEDINDVLAFDEDKLTDVQQTSVRDIATFKQVEHVLRGFIKDGAREYMLVDPLKILTEC